MGFCIALDDAGSGCTTFFDLLDYSIDVVKIDRSFLRMSHSDRGGALLRGLISLLYDMEMEVVCEGAETLAQAEFLQEIGCDYIQGYHFYCPVSIYEAEQILNGGGENRISWKHC